MSRSKQQKRRREESSSSEEEEFVSSPASAQNPGCMRLRIDREALLRRVSERAHRLQASRSPQPEEDSRWEESDSEDNGIIDKAPDMSRSQQRRRRRRQESSSSEEEEFDSASAQNPGCMRFRDLEALLRREPERAHRLQASRSGTPPSSPVAGPSHTRLEAPDSDSEIDIMGVEQEEEVADDIFNLVDTTNEHLETIRSMLEQQRHMAALINTDTAGFTEAEMDEHMRELARIVSATNGLSEAQIERIPCYTYGQGDEITCTVCLDTVETGQRVRVLPCTHQFHALCVDSWLEGSGTCPLCRAHPE